MKILVSHFGRQYCHQLLRVLANNHWLVRFFTAMAGNKAVFWARIPRFATLLRKRQFPGIPLRQITHFPLLFLLEGYCRHRFPWLAEACIRHFDRRVAAAIKKHPCDLVITYENTNLETLKMARQLGKTTLLDLAQIHHTDIVKYAPWFMSPQVLEQEIREVNPRKAEALHHTDYVLTLSGFAADSMRQNGWPEARLFTVNLGIDPQQFSLKTPTMVPGSPLKLLFVGTMTRRKGLDILFQAMAQLPAERLELTLIGPMADAAELLDKYAAYFTYLPFLHHDELVRYYQEADVFVFPSLLDSWAQTVLEAMACGTPAIVTENTGAKDAVRQGGGWVIPPNDVTALVETIQHCLNQPDEIIEKGKMAHQIAQQYTWKNYQAQLTAVLTKIAQHQQLPL